MKGYIKKCIRPYNDMSAVVESSFLRPKNVARFNSKLGWAAMRTEQIIDCSK